MNPKRRCIALTILSVVKQPATKLHPRRKEPAQMNRIFATVPSQIREPPLDALECERVPVDSLGAVQSGSRLLLLRPHTDKLAVAADHLAPLFLEWAAVIGSGFARLFCADNSADLLLSASDLTEPHARASHGVPVWGPVFQTRGLIGIELPSVDNQKEVLTTSSPRFASELEPASLALVWGINAALKELDWTIEQRLATEKLAFERAEADISGTDLKNSAMRDALTGLPNRRHVGDHIDTLIARGAAPGAEVALLHIDLDRFKHINDTLGHPAGDKVLCHVATVLTEHMRGDDIAARVGGDEFIVFCEAETNLTRLTEMAQQIVDALAKPFEIDGKVCRFGASIGIARDKLQSLDFAALTARADKALYNAKRAGRNRWSAYTVEMEEQARAMNDLGDDIQRGLDAGEFHAVYHPQFDARTLNVVGVEALARWHHPQRGIMTPDQFLAAAEERGVIGAIDAAILKCAVRDREEWIRIGHLAPKISVNVSERRLRSQGLLAEVRALSLPVGAFTFELLESIDLDDPDVISASNIEGLRAMGVDIEIDDFGTGRTSILSLVRLKPSRLKIDQKLVAPIITSDSALKLVASIIEIGRTLGIGVTAEGVSTLDHAAKLRDIGCGVLQGSAFSTPQPADALLRFMTSRAWCAA